MKRTDFSDFGIGTWNLGGRGEPDYSHDAQNVESLRYAILRGVNFFDTAEMYASGHSEELLGKALQGEDRKRFFITTKAWPSSFGNLENSMRNSLKRLNICNCVCSINFQDSMFQCQSLKNQSFS